MGEIQVRGPEALALVNYVTCNDAAKLADGQAQYSALLYPNATFVDDILVHRFGGEHFFICVNASNQEKDYDWIVSESRFDAEVKNAGPDYVQLAVQGPKGLETLAKLTDTDLGAINYYWFTTGQVGGAEAIIARTGYTGEDGFEIYIAPAEGERIWNALLEAGEEFGIVPCGLGARNTLRHEAAMSLFGHEIDDTITPYEARLGWIVKLGKGDFIGRDVLERQKQDGVKRRIAGFEMRDRGIARDGYRVLVNGVDAGWVTSGGPSPTLEKNIGLCMISLEAGKPGAAIEIQVRQRAVAAEIVPTPFYSRKN
jgi:aminomethyltransferase